MFLRLNALRWLLALAALAALALAALVPALESAAVVTEPVVSVDTDPAGNTATLVGSIDPCREVTVGSQFNVDVTIEQVTNLAGFEAKLGYNPAVLKVTGVDYNYFLATAGSVTNWGEAPGPQQPDTDGSLDMVATLSIPLPATGASGEGVLARVSLEAVASGLSGLNLSGIKLADINNLPIGDETGDQIFDGPVYDGQIAVDQSCSAPTPSPTADPPVGGVAELPDAAAPAGGSGPSIDVYAMLAALVALGASTLTLAGWYARRRGPSG